MKNKIRIITFFVIVIIILIIIIMKLHPNDYKKAICYATEKSEYFSLKEMSDNSKDAVVYILEIKKFPVDPISEMIVLSEYFSEYLELNPDNILNNGYRIGFLLDDTDMNFTLSNYWSSNPLIIHESFDSLGISCGGGLGFYEKYRKLYTNISYIGLWNNSAVDLLPQIEECFDSLDYLFCQASDEVCEEFRLKFPDCIVENK